MCAPCAAAAAAQAANREQRRADGDPRIYTGVNPCPVTKELLKGWQQALECVKVSGKAETIGLYPAQINQMLGIIQSALNYPDNYCYFEPQLEYFQNTVLPQIMLNVSECIN